MARKPKPRPGERALLRRYGAQLASIRERYESEAADLRREARRLESDYKVLAREFRREVAVLKRKGVLNKSVDVRGARPTSALSRTLNDLYDVVKGTLTTRKVEPATARKLRAQNFQVIGDRVVIDKRYRIKKGEVVEAKPRAPGMHTGGVVRRINLHSDYEERVRKLFDTIGANEFVGVDFGNNFSRVFNADEVDDFLDYLEGGGSFKPKNMKSVSVIRLRQSDLRPYFTEMARRRLTGQDDMKKRRQAERRRERAARKRWREGQGGAPNIGKVWARPVRKRPT